MIRLGIGSEVIWSCIAAEYEWLQHPKTGLNYYLQPGPAEDVGWRDGPRLDLLGQFTAGYCWKQTAQTCLNEHDEG